MNFVRYSATEMFGIPIDDPISAHRPGSIMELMERYNIEPQEVPRTEVDITPPYWANNSFNYLARLAHPEGPVVVRLIPRKRDSAYYELRATMSGDVEADEIEVREIEIPTDQEAMIIAGGSPRFLGKICIHEIIAQREI